MTYEKISREADKIQQKIIEKLEQTGLVKAVYRYFKDGKNIYTIIPLDDEDRFTSLHIFELYDELLDGFEEERIDYMFEFNLIPKSYFDISEMLSDAQKCEI